MPRLLLVSLALTLVLTPVGSTTAQPADSVAITDSLKIALQQFEGAQPPTAPDSAEVKQWADSLYARGKSLQRNNPGDARSLLHRALDGHRALADSGKIANAIGEIGTTHYNQSHLEKALARYREELTISQDIGDRQGVADALQTIGSVYLRKGRFNQALNHYHASLRTCLADQVTRRIISRIMAARTIASDISGRCS